LRQLGLFPELLEADLFRCHSSRCWLSRKHRGEDSSDEITGLESGGSPLLAVNEWWLARAKARQQGAAMRTKFRIVTAVGLHHTPRRSQFSSFVVVVSTRIRIHIRSLYGVWSLEKSRIPTSSIAGGGTL
jgi:hypothetical protein